ncbi:G-protein coupled receptor Mth-like isoform X2 [Lycorma delicatula]|uniref:G-protein coupled receptor Mth-like isoform X2 n=1 Tax=Lycorma delicatula TaxID=130591 RepID=UPI003F512CB8
MYKTLTIQLTINVIIMVQSKEISLPKCELDLSVLIESSKIIHDDLITNDGTKYPKGTYWKDKQGNIRGCICKIKRCIRKCCPSSQSIINETCSETKKQFFMNKIPFSDSENKKDTYHFIYGSPCNGSLSKKDFKMSKEGEIIGIGHNANVSEYCIENYKRFNGKYIMKAYICVMPNNETRMNSGPTTQKEGLLVSAVFFCLTFIAYGLIPDLRNLNGICLMIHVACFFMAYIHLAIVQISAAETSYPIWLCKYLGYMTYFSFFAGFLWLNVMCFDVWWVFKKMQPTSSSGGSVRLKENKEKFIAYSIYAWGTALGFLIILILMDCIPEDATSETFSFIKPKFGQNTCWILEYKSIWLYFYGPLLLLFLSNIFFFVITIKKVIGFSRQTKVLKNKNSRRHTEREYKRYMVYMKLFVIMGVPWILEVISSVTIQMYPKTKYNDLWYIVDFFNSLRGLLIFVIFVMKKRILRKLNNKFCPSVKIWSDHNFLSRRCTYSSTSGSVAERRKDSVADSVASLQRLNSVATSTSSVSEIRKNSLIAYHKNSMSDEIDGGKMKPLTIQEEDSPDL